MATILLVEDACDLGADEVLRLEVHGHRVIRCGGSAGPHAACPMLRVGSCPLPDSADLIVFSCEPSLPTRMRAYTGSTLLRAYRSHPRYGRLPMVVVSTGTMDHLTAGRGPLVHVERSSHPWAVSDAVIALLAARTDVAGPHGAPIVLDPPLTLAPGAATS